MGAKGLNQPHSSSLSSGWITQTVGHRTGKTDSSNYDPRFG